MILIDKERNILQRIEAKEIWSGWAMKISQKEENIVLYNKGCGSPLAVGENHNLYFLGLRPLGLMVNFLYHLAAKHLNRRM